MAKITYLPGEVANAAVDENGKRLPVTRTQHIFDDTLNKPQSQVNVETTEAISDEVTRAQNAESGLDTRLRTVEELAEISVGGGNIGIGTAADFESDDPEDLAKVPTVGAMLGGANDGVYDITARHSGTKYADLAAALGTDGANVPVGVRKGGMSIKFVQSSDNKYVQFRCMAQNFTTDVTQWQGVDSKVSYNSKNLIESGAVEQAISPLGRKVANLDVSEEDGVFITDREDNIGALIDDEGNLDALGLGENLSSIVQGKIDISIEQLPETIEEEINEHIADDIEEEGLYFVDDDYNVGTKIDKDGHLDAIDFGYNLKSIINTIAEEKAEEVKEDLEETINAIPLKENYVEENGLFVTDENLNVGAKVDDGGFDAIKFGHNLYNQVPSQSDINTKIDREEEIPLSPLYVKKSTGVTKQLTIPSVGAKEKWIQTIRLHYKEERGNKAANDVFFDGDCETDFSDVRFLDADGNIIKAVLGNPVHFDLVECNINANSKGSYLYVCPNGNLIITGDAHGIRVSTDGGKNYTVVPGYANGFTEHESNVYHMTSMCVIFVDSNNDLFGYAGGKLYKITYASDYTSYTEVLDFSYVNGNGVTIYPDIQTHAMDKDINGNYYIGTYQLTSEKHAPVYVSTDGGNTFSLSYLPDNTSDFGKNLQHVHHIHADKYTSAVYVGIDGDNTKRGPAVVKTIDGGNTWEDVSYLLREQRGHDYFPNYFGHNFFVGGGESYVLGGGAIARYDYNSQKVTIPVLGSGGARNIVDLGSENIIITGLQSDPLAQESQIIVSYDKGKTWDLVAIEEKSGDNSSGSGYRICYSLQTINGETEKCAILFNSNKSKKVFVSGDNYYREAYLLMENIPSGDITITVESGYKKEYPYKNIRGIEYKNNLVYEIPLSEGFGNVIHDSLGNHAVVNGSIEWENINVSTVRYGDCSGLGKMQDNKIHSAARFAGVVNFGKIPAINFKKNFTITFWLNEKAVANDYAQADALNRQFDDVNYQIMAVGAFRIVRYNPSISICSREAFAPRNTRYIEGGLRYSPDYKFYAISVEDGTFKVYVNGSPAFTQAGTEAYTGFNDKNLSEEDLIIGTPDNNVVGYLSDIKIYNKALTNAEVTNLYKGFNFV